MTVGPRLRPETIIVTSRDLPRRQLPAVMSLTRHKHRTAYRRWL